MVSHGGKKTMVTSTLVRPARRRRCSSFGGGGGGGGGGGEGQAPPTLRHAAAAASRSQPQRREKRLPEEAAGSGVAMGDGCGGSAAGVAAEARRRVASDVSMVTLAVSLILVYVRSLASKSASLRVPVITNENATAGLKDMPGSSGLGGGEEKMTRGRGGEGGGGRGEGGGGEGSGDSGDGGHELCSGEGLGSGEGSCMRDRLW